VISLESIAQQTFNLVVIGGGINGAGVARDGALRGLKVLLVEKRDFASGTSSHSSRLVHGGVRYLEQLDFKLVFEACRERHLLRHLAPHLVWPLPFLIPIYQEDKRRPWEIRTGMFLYDLMALFRNVHPHQAMSKTQMLEREPNLKKENLLGGVLYWDAQMNDARLCLENILSAEEKGAVCLNGVKANKIEHFHSEEKPFHVELEEVQSKKRIQVWAHSIVNAAGPWVDDLLEHSPTHGQRRLRRTKGVHVFVPRLTRESALLLSAQKDNRVFFVLPWENFSYIGTTDSDFSGNSDDVHATREDVDYLLNETLRALPTEILSRQHIQATYAGLRALVRVEEGSPSSVTREHLIAETMKGFFSIIGGKYTTYRLVAEQTVNQVCKHLRKNTKSTTSHALLFGAMAPNAFEVWKKDHIQQATSSGLVTVEQAQHLIYTYGTKARDILNLIKQERPLSKSLHPKRKNVAAEVVYAFQKEKAQTLIDFLWRRTTFSSHFSHLLEAAPVVGETMVKYLSFTKSQVEDQMTEVKKEIEKNITCLK
jgi:glycerol-3-phosphate dehydrogenase